MAELMANNDKKIVQPRIAIGFFGITRSLKWTLSSIQKNIIEPASNLGDVRLFAHLYQQEYVLNPRSGEDHPMDPNEHQLLECDEIKLEKPGACLAAANYEWIHSYGDAFYDNGKSLANLIHQLHSLQQLGRMMNEWKPDLYVLTRPDLLYHNSFYSVLVDQLKSPSNSLTLPNWQWFGGYNDRFAICRPDAGIVYTNRIDLISEYLQRTGGPLPAERFLRFNLHKNKVALNFCDLTASRVRANGEKVEENFNQISFTKRIKRYFQKYFD